MNANLPYALNLISEIINELAPGRAALTTKHQRDGELFVEVVPTNPKAAKMAVRGGGALQYDVYVGEGTLYELPGTETASPTDQLRELSRAVSAGKFEETIWKVGDAVAKTVGYIQLGDHAGKTRQIHGFYPLRFKKKTHIKYEPY